MHRRPTKVLLIESDPDYKDDLIARLGEVRASDLQVEWAGELSGALARLSQGGIDVVLLDLELPDSEGIVTFERTYAFAPDVPVIVLAERADEEVAMATVQGGAQEYLAKEEVHPSLLARTVRHAVERHRLLSALRSLSLIDDLTGLYNRRGFADLGDQHLKLARRSGRGVTLVYVDLDRFKTINDSLGHHVGDRALIRVADILRDSFRRSDILARMGGDEFAVLALEASGENTEMMIHRLRERVMAFNRNSPEPYRLAMSIGTARHDGDTRIRLDDLVAQADSAMYEEKRGKRKIALQGL